MKPGIGSQRGKLGGAYSVHGVMQEGDYQKLVESDVERAAPSGYGRADSARTRRTPAASPHLKHRDLMGKPVTAMTCEG